MEQTANTMVLPLSWLEEQGACPLDMKMVRGLYPNGVPITADSVEKLLHEGVDVIWAGVRLLNAEERIEFILFTLRQQQPHCVLLLEKAGLPVDAGAVAGLVFDTREQLGDAYRVLNACAEAYRLLNASNDTAALAAWNVEIGMRAAVWAVEEINTPSAAVAGNASWYAVFAAAAVAVATVGVVAFDTVADAARARAKREHAMWLLERIQANAAAGTKGAV